MFKTTAINYLKSVAAFHSPISDIKLFTKKKSKKLPEKSWEN